MAGLDQDNNTIDTKDIRNQGNENGGGEKEGQNIAYDTIEKSGEKQQDANKRSTDMK